MSQIGISMCLYNIKERKNYRLTHLVKLLDEVTRKHAVRYHQYAKHYVS